MDLLSAVAAALAIVGALLLSLRAPGSAWAWPLWAVSNLLWMAWGWRMQEWPLVAQQGVFLVTSLIGCWVWLIDPALDRALDRLLRMDEEVPAEP